MGGLKSGLLGSDPPQSDSSGDDPFSPLGGGDAPGPIGLDARRSVQRIIAAVTKDWDPPAPRTTPEIIVRGATLAAAARDLDALGEWGQAGGSLRADPIAAGTSTNLTVNLRGNLVYRLPQWTGYDRASAAAKAEWDRMMTKLRAHEDRHLAIAIEEGDRLAGELVGHEIGEIAAMVTKANRRMRQRQDQLDTSTDHGARTGVPFGDVVLDTSIA